MEERHRATTSSTTTTTTTCSGGDPGQQRSEGQQQQETTTSKTETQPSISNAIRVQSAPLKGLSMYQILFILVGCICLDYFSLAYFKNNLFTSKEAYPRESLFTKDCPDGFGPKHGFHPECVPLKCGLTVMDDYVSFTEIDQLLSIAKVQLNVTGQSPPDSNAKDAVSHSKQNFSLIHPDHRKTENMYTERDSELIRRLENKVKTEIANEFGVSARRLSLTGPAFFARVTAADNEYQLAHMKDELRQNLDYSVVLFLGTNGEDVDGGRFIFIQPPLFQIVDPKKARIVFVTGKHDQPHYITKVTSGDCYLLIFPLSCAN